MQHMRVVTLTGKKYPGLVTLVDDADFDLVSRWPWFATADGPRERTFYATRTQWDAGKYRRIRMHTLLLQPPPGFEVDHRNGDGLDNRRANLRICTHAENMRNRRLASNNSSGYSGVQWGASEGRWRATMWLDGKLVILGLFDDPAEAALVRDAAARRYWGDFARPNFPHAE